MKKDAIGNRMKENYENRYRFFLTRRTPVIMRLDGRAFHTITRKSEKPFDSSFNEKIQATALYLCNEIQGSKCAYVQSDEISILITDFDKLTTSAWFDYNIQKMVSISAGIASSCFSWLYGNGNIITFDSRVFNVPKEEVCNYFIWRQLDWIRNSVQMLAQSKFSTKQLHKKNQSLMHEMLHEIGINWSDLNSVWKNGSFIYKTVQDENPSFVVDNNVIFKQNREVIEGYLKEGI
jgi:tRNA(His) 5'-end guanylyltransferase